MAPGRSSSTTGAPPAGGRRRKGSSCRSTRSTTTGASKTSGSIGNWEVTMKLYTQPVSTACRPVMQFIADNNIACDMVVVDILKGQHDEPAYGAKSPKRLVPML